MASIQIKDSATWRTPTGVFVNDSGTWRTIKTVQVNDSGTWRTVYSSSLGSIVIVGGQNGGGDSIGYSVDVGHGGGPFGTLNSNTLSFGTGLSQLADNFAAGYLDTVLIVPAGSDPGQGVFTTMTVQGGVSRASASAVYSYSGGEATWTWFDSASFSVGPTYTVDFT